MPFVLDASVSLSWYLPDEQNEDAQRVLASLDDDTAVVPGLGWSHSRMDCGC